MKQQSFISKNLIVIVMVPMLIGAHYAWYKLQHVDSLVSPAEREKLPLTRALEKLAFRKE